MPKALGLIIAALALAVGVVWVLYPPERVDTAIRFDPAIIGDDPDAHFAASEARFDDITLGAEKSIRWSTAPGIRTDIVIVYLHGFSATAAEIRPVPEDVADRLGANLVFTRLKGHGRDGAAMDTATATDWIDDLDEALAVAHAVGDRVVLMGTSTGATLAAVGLAHARAADAAVFIAPNFRIAEPGAFALTWPGAQLWLPAVFSAERGFEPLNEAQERFWTTRYPTTAVLPMAALVAEARRVNYALIDTPTLFYFSDADTVVDHARTREVAAAWGGPTTTIAVEVGPDDDPSAHVIAGDIASPGRTDITVEDVTAWLQALLDPT